MAEAGKSPTMEEAYKTLEKAEIDDSMGWGMKLLVSTLRRKFPDVQEMTTTKLASLLAESPDKVVLVDCRDEKEYMVSHLEKCTLVDFKKDEVDNVVGRIPSLSSNGDVSDKTIVCYCSVGYRSSVMAQKFTSYFAKQPNGGPKGIYNLEGSIFKWANENRPMVTPSGQPTIFAHPYSQVWGKVLYKHLRKGEI